jgi:hypothetical protein
MGMHFWIVNWIVHSANEEAGEGPERQGKMLFWVFLLRWHLTFWLYCLESPSGPDSPPLAGLCFPGNNRGPRTMDDSPALVTTGSWLVYTWQKFEESTLQRDKQAMFFTPVISLSPLVCICCHCSHPSLCYRLGRNHPHWLTLLWKVFICSLLSLLSRMHDYYLLLLICFNRGLNMQPSFIRESCP